MRSVLLASLCLLAVLGSGCRTREDQCQDLCDWEARCVQGAVSVQDCTQDCVRDYDKRSSDCDDAFDDFTTCTKDNDSCPGVDNRCQREAARFIQKCDCSDPVGPLKDLCVTDGRN